MKFQHAALKMCKYRGRGGGRREPKKAQIPSDQLTVGDIFQTIQKQFKTWPNENLVDRN